MEIQHTTPNLPPAQALSPKTVSWLHQFPARGSEPKVMPGIFLVIPQPSHGQVFVSLSLLFLIHFIED